MSGSGFLGGGIGPTAIKRCSGLAAPVPVAGAELLANGGFESWASATDANSWTEFANPNSSVNREDADVYAGTYSLRITTDAANAVAYVSQSIVNSANDWIVGSLVGKSNVSGKQIQALAGALLYQTIPLSTAYAAYPFSLRTDGENRSFQIWRYNPVVAANIYIDNVSVKVASLASLFSTRAYASADCDLSVAITRTACTQAGLAARLDSTSSPANFIIAYETGAGRVKVDKCVAGVYTNIIDGAVTYAAGRVLRLVCSGNNVSVYYNGTQVGTTKTVADAGIASNTRHGLFSTYAANAFSQYTAV